MGLKVQPLIHRILSKGSQEEDKLHTSPYITGTPFYKAVHSCHSQPTSVTKTLVNYKSLCGYEAHVAVETCFVSVIVNWLWSWRNGIVILKTIIRGSPPYTLTGWSMLWVNKRKMLLCCGDPTMYQRPHRGMMCVNTTIFFSTRAKLFF